MIQGLNSVYQNGPPPYKPLYEAENEGMLYGLIQKKFFKYFIEGNSDVDNERLEKLYISTLQSLHPDDAKLINNIKDGVNIFPNITVNLLKEAFPEETSEWKSTRVSYTPVAPPKQEVVREHYVPPLHTSGQVKLDGGIDEIVMTTPLPPNQMVKVSRKKRKVVKDDE